MPCHYVIRHWDAGGGSWTNEIIINNTLVATETGAPAMHPYWADGDYSMTVGKYQNDRGLFRTSIDGCKASNRKLTDVEVEIEFRKVMGYPVS
jgi:alpha-glucosidase (family GH31 glycosyl hydrolase)